MTKEQEIENYRQWYYAGMRAMSKDEMEKIALEHAKRMRQTVQGGDYRMREMAQFYNLWSQDLAEELPNQAPPTRWQRFHQWWSAYFSK